jgi:hypothetical protein
MKENTMSTTVDPSPDTTAAHPPVALVDDRPEALTLRCFAPGGDHEGHPAVTGHGSSVVVLGYSPDHPEILDVHGDHGTYPLAADTSATAVLDPARSADLLLRAVAHLSRQIRTLQTDHRVAEARHARTLEEIRRYAIDRHLDDQYCRQGLNDFLRAFGMPVFEPRIRVSYVITGSYDVEGEDTYSATRDATGYLKVDLSELDGVLDDTDTYTVHVNEATALDT